MDFKVHGVLTVFIPVLRRLSMKAIHICATQQGLLYLDEEGQCWLFELDHKMFKPLRNIGSVKQYLQKGFSTIDSQQFYLMIYQASELLLTRTSLESIIIEDAYEGLLFDAQQVPWYHRVLLKPQLTYIREPEDMIIINHIEYENGDTLLCTTDRLVYDVDDLTCFTIEEINALKSGPIKDNWMLSIPERGIVCYSQKGSKNFIHLVTKYDSYEKSFIAEGHYRQRLDYALPLTDSELEDFKY